MGNNKDHIIDELFSQHLDQAEAPVRESVWEGIAAEMENDRLRKKVVWARFTAAASVLLLLGLGTWFLWGGDTFNATPARFTTENIISLPLEKDDPAASTRSGLAFSNVQSPAGGMLSQLPLRTSNSDNPLKRIQNMFIDQFGTESLREIQAARNNAASPALRKFEDFQGLTSRSVLFPAQLDLNPALLERIEMPEPTETQPTYNAEDFSFDFGKEEDEQSNGLNKRWALGGTFSPDYIFSGQVPVQNDQTLSNASIASREILDPAAAEQASTEMISAYSTGFNIAYDISPRVGVQTGVLYQNRSSSSSNQSVNALGKTQTVSSEFSLDMVEVPVLVKLDVVEKDNFSCYVKSGVSANLLWGYDNTLSNQEGAVTARLSSPEDRVLSPAQGNVLLQTGIRYNFLDKLSMNFEPGLRYGILHNRFAFSGDHPMQISLSTGMSYHF